MTVDDLGSGTVPLVRLTNSHIGRTHTKVNYASNLESGTVLLVSRRMLKGNYASNLESGSVLLVSGRIFLRLVAFTQNHTQRIRGISSVYGISYLAVRRESSQNSFT